MTQSTIKVKAPEGVSHASAEGASYTISEDGFFHLPESAAIALQPMGFAVVKEEVEGNDTQTPAPVDDTSAPDGATDIVLLGAEGVPDGYALEGGDIMPAATVIEEAFKRTGATVEEWNALSDEDRKSIIKSIVSELPLAKVVTDESTAAETLENEGGKPAPETSEGNQGGDGVSHTTTV